tara:strand:- start:5621 stop:6109 length:489 start_codon:yes stop_codon:yes gene_type:complete
MNEIRLKDFKCKDFNFYKMKYEDLDFFNKTRNEVSKWLHDISTHTIEECRRWFDLNQSTFHFIIEKNKEKIGYFRFSNVTKDSLYIGADINKNYRGKGYAMKAYKSVLKELEKLNYENILLEVLEFNHRAINLYKNLGFYEIEKNMIERNGKKVFSIKMKKE